MNKYRSMTPFGPRNKGLSQGPGKHAFEIIILQSNGPRDGIGYQKIN